MTGNPSTPVPRVYTNMSLLFNILGDGDGGAKGGIGEVR